MGFLSILGLIVSPITTIITNYQKKKKAKLDSELRINEAKTNSTVKRLETGQQGDIAWENTALNNTGIKDEVMMVVILLPMVMCFFPGGAELVKTGFLAMKESLPDYWIHAFYALIGVSFGVKKWTDFMSIKKGDK